MNSIRKIKKAGTGFDPLTFNQDVTARDGGVYPADQVRLILDYHWQSANTYWKTNLCSVLHLSNAIDTMSSQVPPDYIAQWNAEHAYDYPGNAETYQPQAVEDDEDFG